MLQWGEGYYRRDGNQTPNSLDPEIAELQELFATVKRAHQENTMQWRQDLTDYLLKWEATHSKYPLLTIEYTNYYSSFEIPFKTLEFQKWVIFF